MTRLGYLILLCAATSAPPTAGDPELARWLASQDWVRDRAVAAVTLGKPGAWDDTHIFAPCVAYQHGRFRLWYCGSRGTVADRLFHVGLATSSDGVHFAQHPDSPVFRFGDGIHSVLTPALLRNANGSVRRENDALRMWFTAADLAEPGNRHTLHETRSTDGIDWSTPSPPQLVHAYAPTIIWDDGHYRLWCVYVETEPWVIKHAESDDGQTWRVTEPPCIVLDQAWEERRLFYPTVVKADGVYLMWYGAYWARHLHKTALGFAVSKNGLRWYKHPQNPVLKPEPNHAWESHYTTSQSVLRLDDGTWRIWYATRKAPPHVNKYYAIGTAHWKGP